MLAALLGAGLSAIQLLPSSRFLSDSSRGKGIPLAEALPFFTGDIDGPGAPSWLLPPSDQPYVQEIYLGAGALLLAIYGLRTRNARRFWPLLALSALFATIALGRYLPLASLLWRTMPPLRIVRFPEKLIVPLSLAAQDAALLPPEIARASSCAELARAPQFASIGAGASAAEGTVSPQLFEREKLAFAVDTPSASLLILTETALPGWRAFVDGRETAVLSADGVLRSCAVPQGRHQVEFLYAAPGLRAGQRISAASFVLFAAVALVAARRRRAQIP